MDDKEIKIIDIIEDSINETALMFRENGLFLLNEHDVQAFLFNKIKEKMGDTPNGKFNKTSSLVHCELSIYESRKNTKPKKLVF